MINELLTWFVEQVKAELPTLEGRVYPDVAPEKAENPCLVYQLIGDDTEEVLDAGAATHGTLAYQVRIYADGRLQANALREAFRLRFQGIALQAIGGKWKIEGSAWGELADTYETQTKDYGALGVVEFHLAKD